MFASTSAAVRNGNRARVSDRLVRVSFAMELTHFILGARDGRVLVFDDEDRVDFLERAAAAFDGAQLAYALMGTHYHAAAFGSRDELKDALERAALAYEADLRDRHWFPGPLFGPTI